MTAAGKDDFHGRFGLTTKSSSHVALLQWARIGDFLLLLMLLIAAGGGLLLLLLTVSDCGSVYLDVVMIDVG